MTWYNEAGQDQDVFVFDRTTGDPVLGDAANLHLFIRKDGGTPVAISGTPTETEATNDPGGYSFDLSQAETNCHKYKLSGYSDTPGTDVVGGTYFTTVRIEDVYNAKIICERDLATPIDMYLVLWFKNGVLVVSGITLPKVSAVQVSNSSAMFTDQAMTSVDVGFKFSTAIQITPGDGAEILVKATIDAVERIDASWFTRDASW